MMMMKPSDYDDAVEEVEEVLTQREYEKLLAEKDPQVRKDKGREGEESRGKKNLGYLLYLMSLLLTL